MIMSLSSANFSSMDILVILGNLASRTSSSTSAFLTMFLAITQNPCFIRQHNSGCLKRLMLNGGWCEIEGCHQFVSNIAKNRTSTSRGKSLTGTNAHAVGAGLCPSIDYHKHILHVRTRWQPEHCENFAPTSAK